METNEKSKKMFIALGVVVVIIILIVAALQMNKPKTKVATTPSETASSTQTEKPVETNPALVPVAAPEVIKEAKVEAPGVSLITKDNKVITTEGKETVNSVPQSSPLAPQQSGPIAVTQVAPTAVKINVSVAAGYVPNTFTVKPGAPVTVALTSVDQYAHLFSFKDAALSAVGLGVYGGETRAVTFNAPTKPGTYTFFSNMPSQANSEIGTMIVK